jgi:hypothetical protein
VSLKEIKMKPIFDVEKSKQLCPPLYSNGVTYRKRIVLPLDKITYPPTGNPRILKVKANELGPLEDSFTVNGYILSEPPPTIKIDPENLDRFIGLSGFHRSIVAKRIGWNTMMFDVLEFDSPKAERIHKNQTNNHKTPFIPMTIADYIKQVKEAISCNEIENEDKEVIQFIDLIALDKTDAQRKQIFNKFRKHVGTSTTLLQYHTGKGISSTQEFAEINNLPVDGDTRYVQTGKKLGYINSSSTPKTSLVSAKKLSFEYDGEDVLYYTWIETPKEAPALYAQREKHLEQFNNFMAQDCEFIQMIAKKCGHKLDITEIMKNHPFKFAGFLAQDITPDATKGGRPKEEGVVDINGNSIII